MSLSNRRRQLGPPFPKPQPTKRRPPSRLTLSPNQTRVPLTISSKPNTTGKDDWCGNTPTIHSQWKYYLSLLALDPSPMERHPASRLGKALLPTQAAWAGASEIPSTTRYAKQTKITPEMLWKPYCHWNNHCKCRTGTVLNINRVTAC